MMQCDTIILLQIDAIVNSMFVLQCSATIAKQQLQCYYCDSKIVPQNDAIIALYCIAIIMSQQDSITMSQCNGITVTKCGTAISVQHNVHSLQCDYCFATRTLQSTTSNAT